MAISCNLHTLSVCVPETVVTNDDLAKFVDTNDQWIRERTGIQERHRISPDQNVSDLGLAAASGALAASGMDASALTHIISATCTPDKLTPSISCIIAGKLDAGQVMAFDIGAACTGFIYGLNICNAILQTSPDSRILFICAEALTRRLNWRDRTTCVLFGDAAAATIVDSSSSGAQCRLVDDICQSEGKLRDLITIGGGTACQYKYGQPVDDDFFLSMQGRETYRHAVRQMVNVCETILERNHLSVDDVLLVPHQANLRIIEAVGARLKISQDHVFTNVAGYGNTSAASIPLALSEALAKGVITRGDKVLVTAFGAGLTWGAALLYF